MLMSRQLAAGGTARNAEPPRGGIAALMLARLPARRRERIRSMPRRHAWGACGGFVWVLGISLLRWTGTITKVLYRLTPRCRFQYASLRRVVLGSSAWRSSAFA
jgi:hypothetical protein